MARHDLRPSGCPKCGSVMPFCGPLFVDTGPDGILQWWCSDCQWRVSTVCMDAPPQEVECGIHCPALGKTVDDCCEGCLGMQCKLWERGERP